MAAKRNRRKKKQTMTNTSTSTPSIAVPDGLTPEEKKAWLDYFNENDDNQTVASKPLTTTGTTSGYRVNTCTHPARKVIVKLGDVNVYCGAKMDTNPLNPLYDTVLDVGAHFTFPAMPIGEMNGFGEQARARLTALIYKPRLITLNWPDYGVFPAKTDFWQELWAMITEEGTKDLLIACQGGHGRTGTALASLMVCNFDYAPAEAAELIRKEHCKNAIETESQVVYINRLYDEIKKLYPAEHLA